MSATKLAVAQGLAITGLVSILINAVSGGLWPLGGVPSGMIIGPIGAFTSIAAFFVSLNRKSILVPVLLVVTGVVSTIQGVLDSANLTILAMPGPILQFIFGVVVLALGIVKSVMTGKSMRSKTTTAAR